MTDGATGGSAGRATPLAPARTRTPARRVPADTDLPLLPPVLSGLFSPRHQPPVTAVSVKAAPAGSPFVDFNAPAPTIAPTGLPLIPDDQTAGQEDILEAAVDWFGDDDSAPWEQTEEAESSELFLEIEEESVELVPADDTEDELVLADPTEQAPVRPAPAPLSPWDLGAASASAEAEAHAARARAEWESLGEALTGSLSVDSPAKQPRGTHEIELTDEIVASLEAQVGESYSPFTDLNPPSAYSGLASGQEGEPGGSKRAALSDLARRLEAFAARIRAEGPEALSRAQREGDRVDALLAGIAAGFIAGRAE